MYSSIGRFSIRSSSRCISVVRRCSSTVDGEPSFVSSRPHPLIDKIIRVNHAGEFGATRIYAGQSSCTEQTNVRLTIEVILNISYVHAHEGSFNASVGGSVYM